MNEITLTQVVSGPGQSTLTKALPKSYDTYRTIRKDPTIFLAYSLSMAPILAAEWSTQAIEDAPEGAEQLIQDVYFPLREAYLETALSGGISFGWQGFEQVFDVLDGLIVLKKLKPLIPDITDILVEKQSGAFAGYKQQQLILPVENSLHVAFRVEGTKWTGNALLENARAPYNEWIDANQGARRYDLKVAGSHFIIHYPEGSSLVDGEEVDNGEIAQKILKSLESSGGAAIPHKVVEHVDDLGKDALDWRIDIVSDATARQASFTDRLKYLDALKVRALLMPERALLESKFGTKADAGQHADLALTHMDLTHRFMTRIINWHSVNRLLVLNYGPEAENAVRLVTAPLSDEKLTFYRDLYMKIIEDPSGVLREFESVDWTAIKESLAIPIAEPDAIEGMDIADARADTAREIFGESDE